MTINEIPELTRTYRHTFFHDVSSISSAMTTFVRTSMSDSECLLENLQRAFRVEHTAKALLIYAVMYLLGGASHKSLLAVGACII